MANKITGSLNTFITKNKSVINFTFQRPSQNWSWPLENECQIYCENKIITSLFSFLKIF